MAIRILTVLLVIVSGVLCSGTQQGVSSTQAGQTLQIQPNARKYNKHTATEKPCTTSSTTGTRKEKPENYSDTQDYVAIGGNGGGSSAAGPGYPYPAPYQPYQPSNYPYRLQYPYEPQYPVEAAPAPQYYAPPYYQPPAPYAPLPLYPPAAYPAAYPAPYPPPPPQQLYEQATVVDAYRSPYSQQQEQSHYYRQPVAGPYYSPSPLQFRAHAHNRPAAPAFLQQRDAAAVTTAATNSAEPSQQYEPAGSLDNAQYHY